MDVDQAVNRLLEQVYEAPLKHEGWWSVIPALEESLGGGVALFARRQDSVRLLAGCTNCTPAQRKFYEQTVWREDRAMEKLRSDPVGNILLDSRLVSLRERLRSPFYNDYLGAIGVDRGLYASFHRAGDEVFVVSAQRNASRGEYDDKEVKLVRRLAPHLRRSFRTWERLRKAQEERIAAIQALDHASMGMIIVDAKARVRFANRPAESHFRAGSLRLHKERLVGRDPQQTHRLRRAIERAARSENAMPDTVELPSAGTHRQLSIMVTPLSSLQSLQEHEPLAIVLLGATEEPAIEQARLRRAYDLTPAEAQLLSALVAGERLPDYARRRGISVTTAKFHLSALFDKTGERRQADLIRLALSDPLLRLKLGRRAD